jgi:hypothetical protein
MRVACIGAHSVSTAHFYSNERVEIVSKSWKAEQRYELCKRYNNAPNTKERFGGDIEDLRSKDEDACCQEHTSTEKFKDDHEVLICSDEWICCKQNTMYAHDGRSRREISKPESGKPLVEAETEDAYRDFVEENTLQEAVWPAHSIAADDFCGSV